MARREKLHTSLLKGRALMARQVADVARAEGFETYERIDGDVDDSLDVYLVAGDGQGIGLDCGRARRFHDDDTVSGFLDRIGQEYGPLRIVHIGIVDRSFSQPVRDTLDAYPGIDIVPFGKVAEWLKKFKPRTRTSTVAAHIDTNRDGILIAAAGLKLAVDEKLDELTKDRPNSDEAKAARAGAISDYQALKKRVEELEKAVIQFDHQKIKEQAVEKKAAAFQKGVASWWEKQHQTILSSGYNLTAFCSALTICTLLGVPPIAAASIVGALVGGKTVADAAKSLSKRHL